MSNLDVNAVVRNKKSHLYNGGQTGLMTAALVGYLELAKLFLEHGADSSIPEQDGYTPMHGAAFQGRADMVKLLKDNNLKLIGMILCTFSRFG